MPIPPHLPQVQYGYDNGFTTIIFDFENISLGFRSLLRVFKAILLLIGGYSLVNYTLEKKIRLSSFSIKESLFIITFSCIVLHSLIMILQFIFPDFRDFIYSFTAAQNQFAWYQHFRMAGLAGAGGAQISMMQGFGFPIGIYFMLKNKYWTSFFSGNIIIFISFPI
mgnify:CR=1 FL=1